MHSRAFLASVLFCGLLCLPLFLITAETRGEDDLGSLLALLKHRDPATRLSAIRKLVALKDPGAVEPLIKTLTDQPCARRPPMLWHRSEMTAPSPLSWPF